MADDFLAQGITAVKAGNKQEARQLLDAAIRAAPDDIRGWSWFYEVCENKVEKARCLGQILRIDPNNADAKRNYAELAGMEEIQPNSPRTKKCPYCAEEILEEAVVCRYCGRDYPQPVSPEVQAALDQKAKAQQRIAELQNKRKIYGLLGGVGCRIMILVPILITIIVVVILILTAK